MRVFSVVNINQAKTADLKRELELAYPGDASFELAPGNWLVASEGTTKDVSDRLGFTKERVSSGVVFTIDSYNGWANPAVWEWLKLKFEQAAVR